MRSRIIVLTLLALVLPASTATPAQAVPAVTTQGCLDLTTRRGLDTTRILSGLGLTPDQVREVRARLVSYWGARPFRHPRHT